MEELDAIRDAAKAATPGPWVANVLHYKNGQTGREGFHWWITTEQGHTLPMDSAGDKRAEFNAKLIALVSPATVLRLVEQARPMEWRNEYPKIPGDYLHVHTMLSPVPVWQDWSEDDVNDNASGEPTPHTYYLGPLPKPPEAK